MTAEAAFAGIGIVGSGLSGSGGSLSGRRNIGFAIDNKAGAVDRRIGFAKGGDDSIAAAFNGSEIDEQHLILAMVDDLPEGVAAANQVSWRELALEDRILEMVAEVAHRFEDAPESLVIADVVAYEISIAHRCMII